MRNKYYSFLTFDKTFLFLIMSLFNALNLTVLAVFASEAGTAINSQAIRVVADKVKKDVDDGLVFSGKVNVYNVEWVVRGASGTLYEEIGKSQIIRITGDPAVIETKAHSQYGKSFGSAKELTLDLATDKLELKGNAQFNSQSESLRANEIYYDITTGSMKTKGSRVKFISDNQN